jgi:hypothetical protein
LRQSRAWMSWRATWWICGYACSSMGEFSMRGIAIVVVRRPGSSGSHLGVEFISQRADGYVVGQQ